MDSKSKIEEINNRFYEALNSFDIDIMEDVWLNDSTVKCIHPGWPLIKGWDAVKDSWKNIFESSGFNHVNISKLFIDYKEDYLVKIAQSLKQFWIGKNKWKKKQCSKKQLLKVKKVKEILGE